MAQTVTGALRGLVGTPVWFALTMHCAQVHAHWLVIRGLLALMKADPCTQVSFWGLVSKAYTRDSHDFHPALYWIEVLNVTNEQKR